MEFVNLELSKGIATAPKRQYGVTPPISEAMATPKDFKLTEDLIIAMRQENLYESVEGMKKREYVLASLNKLVREWIYEASLEHSMNEEEALSAGGGIFTFGSYRLGVVAAGSDIDTLCIAPRHISRESFFSFFLAKLQQDINVTKVQPVPDAYTPIIKMVYNGMEIDLLFACLNLSKIPSDLNTLDDDLLRNVDDKTARSLNGCRVNDMILQLVPNKETFRTSLRFVKHWSKARGIYSNVLGYLGGISWAILTARICQLYPNAAPNQIINRFFYIYKTWQWKNPVILCEIKEVPKNTPGLMGFRVWNPNNNPQDRAHVMPIITPAFPSMNSTHNVTQTTLRVITEELQRAYQIIVDIENERATWRELLAPYLFFEKHKHFIQVKMLANNEQAFQKWIGWIESKLRFLVRKLETFKGLQVRPWPKAIQESDEFKDGYTFGQSMYIGLVLNSNNNTDNISVTNTENTPVVDLRGSILDFVGFIMNWSEVETFKDSIDLKVKHLRSKDLPRYIKEQYITSSNNSSQRTSKSSKNLQSSKLLSDNENRNNSVDGNTNPANVVCSKGTPTSFVSSQQSTTSIKRSRNEIDLDTPTNLGNNNITFPKKEDCDNISSSEKKAKTLPININSPQIKEATNTHINESKNNKNNDDFVNFKNTSSRRPLALRINMSKKGV